MFTHFIEFQQWGLNKVTLGFGLVVVTTVLFVAPGFWKQARKIWHDESGDGVLTFTFTSSLAFSAVLAGYSWLNGRGGGFFNGTICTLTIALIVLGLKKYKGFGRSEWLQTAVTPVAIGVILLVPSVAALLYLVLSIVVWFGMLLQGATLWNRPEKGSAAGGTWVRLALASFALAGYGFIAGDIPIIVNGGLFGTVQSFTAVAIYRKPKSLMRK